MKSFTSLLLFSVITVITSTPIYLYREVSPGVFAKEDISEPFRQYNASDDDIKIYFKSRTQSEPVLVDVTNSDTVDELGFSSAKDTMFIVHGWLNEYDSPFNNLVSESVLGVKDVNVFIVDWSAIAREFYTIAVQAVPDVANILSTLVIDLVANNNLNLDKTSIVGHSLGAHVAGLTGMALKGKIDHIVGLDPALPWFSYDEPDKRLDDTDAKFVQVIHTSGGKLGYDVDIGDADYHPNGGKEQPGCTLDIAGTCAHSRSYRLYAESLSTGGFVAKKCDSYDDFENGNCNGGSSHMGEYDIDKTASGTYYLDTNSDPPYARN